MSEVDGLGEAGAADKPDVIKRLSPWLARAALLGLLYTAVASVLDPLHSREHFMAHPDQVEHFAYAFAFTLAGTLAFPRIPVVMIGGALLIAGGGLEVLQAFKVVYGLPQVGDFIADALGIGAVLVAIGVGAARRYLRCADQARQTS